VLKKESRHRRDFCFSEDDTDKGNIILYLLRWKTVVHIIVMSATKRLVKVTSSVLIVVVICLK